ncbi:MAG: hypothetical protein RR506_03390 [Akkermansia sp.]
MNLNSIVLGYHGCTSLIAEQIFQGKIKHLKKSHNSYDWLGDGIYFWENDPQRAFNWAEKNIQRKRMQNDTAAVVGAIIAPKLCLDLTTLEDIKLIKDSYKLYKFYNLLKGFSTSQFPKNHCAYTGDKDILCRDLDCAVIQFLHTFRKVEKRPAFDSVRGAFHEGAPAFEGSMIMEKTHIQWAIRNPEKCILGYFRPLQVTMCKS